MNIIWEGPLLDPSGYGKCARDYVAILSETDWANILVSPVRYYSGKSWQPSKTQVDLLNRLSFTEMGDGSVLHIEHKTPTELNHRYFPNVINAGYTVWETPVAPRHFVPFLNKKKFIITPTAYSARAFINAGYTGDIEIIPHYIEENNFEPPNLPEQRPFVFLSVGEFTYRKGFDLLLQAYAKAFSKEDNVMLLIKTYLLDGTDSNSYIQQFINKYLGPPSVSPAVKVINDILSDQQALKLYKYADAYVSATRGEGFGLPIAEAMAAGLPAIVPSLGGQSDYCDCSNSYVYDSEFVRIPDNKVELTRSVYRGLEWIEPDVEDLADQMRKVYSDERATKIGLAGKEDVLKYCSAENITRKFKELECFL